MKAMYRDGVMKHPRIVERDTKYAIVELPSEADFAGVKARAPSAQRA